MVKVRRLAPICDSLEPTRTRFMLDPLGTGTSDLEALSSFFCRIAEHHWMLTVPLWNAIADHASKVKRARRHPQKRLTLRSMNGHGRVASTVAELLRRESLIADHLTLLPWKGVLDPMAHDLLRPVRAWCPLCWSEDRDSGGPIYMRLLWVLSVTLVCPKHQVELQTVCRNCKNPQEVLPRIPRLSVCNSCGADLVQQMDRRRIRSYDPRSKEVWIASALASLIQCTCASGVTIDASAFKTALKTLAVRHFGGSLERLADACGMSRRMVRQWACGETKPYLSALMELAYRTQIPPAVMLLEGVGLAYPNSWTNEKRPTFVVRGKKLTGEELSEIRLELVRVIKSKTSEIITVKKFAKRVGTTYLVIRYHFPEEYQLLQKKGRLQDLRNRQTLRSNRIKQTIAAAHSLAERGVYPSDRALKGCAGIIASSLRRLEVKKAVRAVRLEFLAGAYSTVRRRTKN